MSFSIRLAAERWIANAREAHQVALAGQQRELDLRQQPEVCETEILLGVDLGAGLRGRLVDAQLGLRTGAEQIDLDAQPVLDDVRAWLRRPIRQLRGCIRCCRGRRRAASAATDTTGASARIGITRRSRQLFGIRCFLWRSDYAKARLLQRALFHGSQTAQCECRESATLGRTGRASGGAAWQMNRARSCDGRAPVRACAWRSRPFRAPCSSFFLVLLARSVQQDPLGPLRDVRFSVVGVGINFAFALGSVVAFGYWRRIERTRAAQRGAR